jgi:hypothetical protein
VISIKPPINETYFDACVGLWVLCDVASQQLEGGDEAMPHAAAPNLLTPVTVPAITS